MARSGMAITRVLVGDRHPSIREADEVEMASLVEAAEPPTRGAVQRLCPGAPSIEPRAPPSTTV